MIRNLIKNQMKTILAVILIIVITGALWITIIQPTQKTLSTQNQTSTFICNTPYIQIGRNCCLDANNNAMCDSNEETQRQTTQSTRTTPKETTQEPATPSETREAQTTTVSQSELPADKPGQPQLVITFQEKASTEKTTVELQKILQKGDAIKVKVTDSRYATPIALATVAISNDATQKATTDANGITIVNITKSGAANITAYKEKFNKSSPFQINAFTSYAAGKLYSLKGKNAKITTNGKWTAWQHDENGQKIITLKDNGLDAEIEFKSKNANYENPTIQETYLLFENTTGDKTNLQLYKLYQKEMQTLANRTKGNYAPVMQKEQAAIITSITNDKNCLTDSKIELVDLYQSPQRIILAEPNKFSLTWKNNYVYYADFSSALKCNYNALTTIPVYKIVTGGVDPVKILEIKKPTYYQLNALDYIYSANANELTFITTNSKGGSAIHYYDFTTQSEQTYLDDGSKIIERTLPYNTGNYLVWTQKAQDGNWHVKILNLATREQKWATWNNQNQTNLTVQANTIYYIENDKINVISIANE